LKDRRYHSFSDYNHLREGTVRFAKVALLLLFLRELPLKNFYARSFVVGTTIWYLWIYHWRYGDTQRAPVYYPTLKDADEFDNYPLLREMVLKRIANKTPSPTKLESDYWWQHQSPVFYMHHFKHYRYIFRRPRVVQWDGTYNQPIFPYTKNNDRTLFVSNGINESVEPKPSGAF
jgi:hypothetical protein